MPLVLSLVTSDIWASYVKMTAHVTTKKAHDEITDLNP